MNTIAILIVVAAIVTSVTAISALSTAALAQKSQGSNGLEVADPHVHDAAGGGLGGQQDVNFHTGLCQGGHSTQALDQAVGGCNGGFIQSPSQLGSGHNGK
jgi:hypothetical protein